jgi:hypothetical protein
MLKRVVIIDLGRLRESDIQQRSKPIVRCTHVIAMKDACGVKIDSKQDADQEGEVGKAELPK